MSEKKTYRGGCHCGAVRYEVRDLELTGKVCGIRSFARGKMRDGSPIAAINLRCLDDIDLASVPTTPYDGRSK